MKRETPKNDEKIPQRAVLGQRGIVSSKNAFPI